MFEFFKYHFQQKQKRFTKFANQEPKVTNLSGPKPQIGPKIQFFKPLFFPKNQFFKPMFFVPDRSLSPHLWPFGPHIYNKIKVEYHRG